MNQKWYEKNVIIILFLFFLFPVGLLFMWKYSNWNKAAKIIISIFIGLVIITNMGNKSKTPQQQTVNSTTQEESKVKEEVKKNKETEIEVAPAITKEYIESKLKDVEIISISNDGDNYYTIDFKVKEVVSDSYYKKSILGEIKDISKVLTDAKLVQGNEFFFEAKGPGKDKYGNESDMNYATAFVKGDVLAKCNYDNLNSEEFENVLESFGLHQSLK